MQLILVVLTVMVVISAIAMFILQLAAYAKREDKSFWGGWNILNGWFLIFPYGKGGVLKTETRLVFWCRFSAAITVVLCALIYWARSS